MNLSRILEISRLILCVLTSFISISCAKDNYEIWHRSLTGFQTHACDGEELHLRCTPSTVISVHYVFYGRQANTGHLCPDRNTAFISTSCESSKALQVIHERCHKHRMCRLYISKETFRDDPCPDVRKFIEVMYKCRPDGFLNKIVCEGGHLELQCPENQGLTIFSATYGTTKEGVVECRQSPGLEPKDCLVESVDEFVRSQCSGRQNCSLRADDTTFGSSGCRGTKHLKVAYNCIEMVLLHYPGRLVAEETIQTTSFPAWVREAQSNLWPNSPSPPSEMQSDEVPADHYRREALAGDQELVGFMSKWMTAHKYMKGNKDKLVLYLTISLGIGFLVFVTVLAGRFLITRLEIRQPVKLTEPPVNDDQFFSDSDLEHFEPPGPLPLTVNYTASMRRKDSEAAPRAPIAPGSDHFFS